MRGNPVGDFRDDPAGNPRIGHRADHEGVDDTRQGKAGGKKTRPAGSAITPIRCPKLRDGATIRTRGPLFRISRRDSGTASRLPS